MHRLFAIANQMLGADAYSSLLNAPSSETSRESRRSLRYEEAQAMACFLSARRTSIYAVWVSTV
jgi:hypothetical protein